MAECASLCLVEHGAKNFIVNAPCVVESFLHRVDLRATPLDDENIQVDEARRCTDVNDRSERAKIDDDILVVLAQTIEQFLHRVGGENFVRMHERAGHDSGEKRQPGGWIDPNHIFKNALPGSDIDQARLRCVRPQSRQ